MSMLQMAGGVAVAGAVAAGTTAFTAAGLTVPGSVTIGGTSSITTINGYTVSNVAAVWDNTTPTNLAGFTLTFSSIPNTTPVYLNITDNSVTKAFSCTAASSNVSNCTITPYAPTSITAINITA